MIYWFTRPSKKTVAATSSSILGGSGAAAAPARQNGFQREFNQLRRFDPNFSEIIFIDFCYALYGRAHDARGHGSKALDILSLSLYGNAASIFTTSGAAARKFRYEVGAGNIGINIGVAAPMAYFPFGGWKDSFFGVLHSQGRDAVEFYTEKKVVIERWPKYWSRKF